MMNDLRLILLIAGVALIAGVFFYTRWQQRRRESGREAERSQREPFLDHSPAGIMDNEPLPNEPYAGRGGMGAGFDPGRQKIVSLHVMARDGSTFPAPAVVEALQATGLKYGRYRIFHRLAPVGGEARTVFSVANMFEPGIFDLDKLADNWLVGITLFMVLPGPRDGVDAFADMLTTARQLAQRLGGEVKDENRSTLTKQTAHHLREEIIEFQLRKKA